MVVLRRQLGVLVVDDDEVFAAICRRMIKDARVIHAPTVEQATAAAREHKPHTILLDVFLDGEDGIEAIGRLRSACDAEIVVVTGDYRQGDADRAFAAGAYAYLEKGDFPSLLRVVRAAGKASRPVMPSCRYFGW